jgi:hypothetical protein
MLVRPDIVSVEQGNFDKPEGMRSHLQHCLTLGEVQDLGRPAEMAAGVVLRYLCIIRTWGIVIRMCSS